MKNEHMLIGLVVCLTALVNTLPAGATGADTPRDSLIKTRRFGPVSIGGAWEKQKRELVGGRIGHTVLETRDVYAIASLDLLPWATILGAIGQSEIKPQPRMSYLDAESAWYAGARVNFWEQEIPETEFLAGTARLQGMIIFAEYEGSLQGEKVSWDERRVAVTLRLDIPADTPGGTRVYMPYSAAFFAGPLYSSLAGDYEITGVAGDPAFDEKDDWGAILGIDVNVTERFSVGWEARIINHATHNVNAAYHF